MNPSISQLLDTADRLLANADALTPAESDPESDDSLARPTATAVGRCRATAFALRIALEIAVADSLAANGAPSVIRNGSKRAQFLWLRSCVEAGTARRARSVWILLCLGCHYHQYESGPTKDQVQAWRNEAAAVAALLGSDVQV
jgi:hypothetical protein